MISAPFQIHSLTPKTLPVPGLQEELALNSTCWSCHKFFSKENFSYSGEGVKCSHQSVLCEVSSHHLRGKKFLFTHQTLTLQLQTCSSSSTLSDFIAACTTSLPLPTQPSPARPARPEIVLAGRDNTGENRLRRCRQGFAFASPAVFSFLLFPTRTYLGKGLEPGIGTESGEIGVKYPLKHKAEAVAKLGRKLRALLWKEEVFKIQLSGMSWR